MPTFEHPPEWWISLANLTDWFDWDAIGAVGTVGALFYTIRLATMSERQTLQRQGVFLQWVADPFKTALVILDGGHAGFERFADAQRRAFAENGIGMDVMIAYDYYATWSAHMKRRFEQERIDEIISSIDRTMFPSVMTHLDFVIAFISWKNIRDNIPDDQDEMDWEYLDRQIDIVQEQISELEAEIAAYRFGPHWLSRLLDGGAELAKGIPIWLRKQYGKIFSH